MLAHRLYGIAVNRGFTYRHAFSVRRSAIEHDERQQRFISPQSLYRQESTHIFLLLIYKLLNRCPVTEVDGEFTATSALHTYLPTAGDARGKSNLVHSTDG